MRDDAGKSVANGVRWQRYALDADAGAIGWGYLAIGEASPVDLLVGAPVLEPLPPTLNARGLSLTAALPRALHDWEHATLDRHRRALGDHLAAPSRPLLSMRPRPGPTDVHLPVR